MDPIPLPLAKHVETIRRLQKSGVLTPQESTLMNCARLEIARWVCREEGLMPNRRNLAAVLGAEGAEALRLLDDGSAAQNAAAPIPAVAASEAAREQAQPELEPAAARGRSAAPPASKPSAPAP